MYVCVGLVGVKKGKYKRIYAGWGEGFGVTIIILLNGGGVHISRRVQGVRGGADRPSLIVK